VDVLGVIRSGRHNAQRILGDRNQRAPVGLRRAHAQIRLGAIDLSQVA
jgi:hypothetical protein